MLRAACTAWLLCMLKVWLHGQVTTACMNGHFTCVHAEDAARVFDKAAVRIRYDKARLNFQFEDYVDDQGQILPDQQVGKWSAHFHQHGIRACMPANCCRQLRLAKRLLAALVVV